MESREVSAELWSLCAEGGFFALLLSEEQGGLGQSLSDVVPLLEEAGEELLPTLVADSILAAPLLAQADPPRLELLLGGRLKVALWGFDAASEGLPRLRPSGGGWQLEGSYRRAPFAASADLALGLVEMTGGNRAVALLPREAFADQAVYQPTLGLMDPIYRVELSGVELGHGAVLDSAAARRLTQVYRLARCAEMVGAADRALARSVDYAKTRHAFGKPIGSFQAVKHKCSDMLLQLETARSSIYYAAWCLTTDAANADDMLAVAESYCASRLPTFGLEGIQINGGIGFTWEVDSHLYLRRLKQHQVLLSYRQARRRLIDSLRQSLEVARV
jgi:alkylation response protein AidB-like acyl-CoA dehydrogenase